MKKNLLYIFLLILSSALISACAGEKKLTATTQNGGSDIKPDKDGHIPYETLKIQETFIEGIKAKLIEEYDEAAKLFEQCVRLDPNNDAAYFELAQLYYASDLMRAAITNAAKTVELEPDNRFYQELYADLLSATGEYEESAKYYEQLSHQFPTTYYYYFEWAYQYIRMNKIQDAIDVYDELEATLGIDEYVIEQKQQLYIKLGKLDKAVDELEKLIEAYPTEPRYLGILAEMYEANDMIPEAKATYDRLLDLSPNDPYATLALAKIALDDRDFETYHKNLKLAFASPDLDIDTKVGVLFPYLDMFENEPERKAEAIELGQILVDTHPKDAKAYAIYGDILYHAEKDKEALAVYKEGVKQDNSVYSVWQQIFFIQSDLGRNDSLAEYTEAALEIFPNQPLIYFFNGLAHNALKEYNEAIEILNIGVELVYGNDVLLGQMYANLGEAYNSTKQYLQSDTAFDNSIKYDPNNAFVLNNYAYYLSLRNEQLEKAERLISAAVRIEPNQSSFEDTYGWILYQMGKYSEAETWIAKAMDHGGSERPVILEHYGDVLYKLGDVDGAVEYWQKALDQGGDAQLIGKKISERKLYD